MVASRPVVRAVAAGSVAERRYRAEARGQHAARAVPCTRRPRRPTRRHRLSPTAHGRRRRRRASG
eukprot:6466739-Prymnesium_polylepis.1